MATISEIALEGVSAHEKAVADSRAMDVAFANGTLGEWVKGQTAQALEEFDGGTAPQGSDGSN